MTNPAGVKSQLIGVSSREYLDRLPLLLQRNGAKNIMTVRSDDGMDEFSTSATNRICILRNGKPMMNSIEPEVLGLHKSKLKDIQIKTRKEAIESFVGVLNNTANQAMIETTVLNAAGGLVVANIAKNFEEAVQIASNTIKEGKAIKLLERFVEDTGDISKLKEIMN